jgi:hypothetical protein
VALVAHRNNHVEITMKDGQVIVTLPKCVLVMTKAEFIEALKRGKVFRRREALHARLAHATRKER